jgi:hypothetical protein
MPPITLPSARFLGMHLAELQSEQISPGSLSSEWPRVQRIPRCRNIFLQVCLEIISCRAIELGLCRIDSAINLRWPIRNVVSKFDHFGGNICRLLGTENLEHIVSYEIWQLKGANHVRVNVAFSFSNFKEFGTIDEGLTWYIPNVVKNHLPHCTVLF